MSSISPSTPTIASPSPSPSSAPTVSVGVAAGMVFCLIAFIFLSVAFWRVARKGDVFPRRPTSRLRQEHAQRRRDYVKFMGRGATYVGFISSRPQPRETSWSGSGPLPLPLYTLSPPPPAYVPGSILPPYDGGTRSD